MPREIALRFTQNWSLWFVLAVTAVVLVSVLFFYRRVSATVARRHLAPLLLLRVAAMVALLLCLFRPVLSFHKSRLEQSKLVFLLDCSKSMSVPQEKSHFERAREVLLDREGRLKDTLDVFDAQWYVFSSNAHWLDGPSDLNRVAADGEVTDLTESVTGALARVDKRDVAGVVLFTDGNHNAASDPAAELPKQGVRIYPIGVGTRAGKYKSVSINRVDAERVVARDNLTPIAVHVDATNYANRVVFPDLRKKGEEGKEQRWEVIGGSSLMLDNKRGSQKVSFRHVPKKKGRLELTAFVWKTERKKEWYDKYDVSMEVTDRQIKVLYVEGVLRSEYREIRRTLQYDPNVQLLCLVKTGGNVFYQQGRIKDIQLSGFPKDLETLKQFDVIMIGSLDRSHLTGEQMGHVKKAVAEGAGFMMLGGGHAYGPGGYTGTPIEEILPVYCGGRDQKQEREPFLPKLTPDGRSNPIFDEELREFFDGLSQRADRKRLVLLGCSVVPKAKPLASVLMRHPDRKNENGPLILLAAQKYREGRVIASMIDSTWKWYRPLRGLGKKSPFVKYWGQTVRWLARDRMTGEAYVIAYTDKDYYEPGSKVKLFVRVTDSQGQAANDAQVTATVTRTADKWTATQQVPHIFGTRGRYETEIDPLEAATYGVTVTTVLNSEPLCKRKLSFHIRPRQKELEKLEMDERLLKDIADRTHGGYYTLESIEQFGEDLRRRVREKMVYREIHLWNAPLLFVGFVLLLTGEWILRRKRQLS